MMNYNNAKIRKWIFEAVESRRAEMGEHPSPETLLAFRSKKLPENEDNDFRDHVGLCRHCADLLLFHASEGGGRTRAMRYARRMFFDLPEKITSKAS